MTWLAVNFIGSGFAASCALIPEAAHNRAAKLRASNERRLDAVEVPETMFVPLCPQANASKESFTLHYRNYKTSAQIVCRPIGLLLDKCRQDFISKEHARSAQAEPVASGPEET